ncbi:twitching motility protein PilT [Deltaproteobacteria bacterium]|nr:twitching motility protein PilT [Deltaproteobacteria bacterium]
MLLDTCSFLWLVTDHPDLSARARAAIANPAHPLFLSAASVWEISVKFALGKLALPTPPRILVPAARSLHRIDPLPFDETDALTVELLPAPHRDPFDRMLIAQAIARGIPILTPDPMFRQYPVALVW